MKQRVLKLKVLQASTAAELETAYVDWKRRDIREQTHISSKVTATATELFMFIEYTE